VKCGKARSDLSPRASDAQVAAYMFLLSMCGERPVKRVATLYKISQLWIMKEYFGSLVGWSQRTGGKLHLSLELLKFGEVASEEVGVHIPRHSTL